MNDLVMIVCVLLFLIVLYASNKIARIHHELKKTNELISEANDKLNRLGGG